MSSDIKSFGTQAGAELINAFKGARLQASLGSSVVTVPLSFDDFEKRVKVWGSSEHRLSNEMGKQLSMAVEQVIQGNVELDPSTLVQTMEFSEDLETGYGYQESIDLDATVRMTVESRASAYKCKSLQELSTADYVLRFNVSSIIEESNPFKRLDMAFNEPIPWASKIQLPGATIKGALPLPFLSEVFKQKNPLRPDDAMALFEVFCGFRVSPSLVNRKETLCEVLHIAGKRVVLVCDENLVVKAYPQNPCELKVSRIEVQDIPSFFDCLEKWQVKYAAKAGYVDFSETERLSAGYVNLDESKKAESIFSFNNASSLVASPLASAPLKKWLTLS